MTRPEPSPPMIPAFREDFQDRWFGAQRPGLQERNVVMSAPTVCPLNLASGRHVACCGESCLFYRVPNVRMECAIEEWEPGVRRDPTLAEWFIALRERLGR